jgi:hypothetical protein
MQDDDLDFKPLSSSSVDDLDFRPEFVGPVQPDKPWYDKYKEAITPVMEGIDKIFNSPLLPEPKNQFPPTSTISPFKGNSIVDKIWPGGMQIPVPDRYTPGRIYNDAIQPNSSLAGIITSLAGAKLGKEAIKDSKTFEEAPITQEESITKTEPKPRLKVTAGIKPSAEPIIDFKPEEPLSEAIPEVKVPESVDKSLVPGYKFKDGKWQKIIPTELPKEDLPLNTEPKLPPVLKGAKPRYITSQLDFESDLDKAAYITAQENKSKADAAYVEWAKGVTGYDESTIRRMGREIKRNLKTLTPDENGVIQVPKFNHEEFTNPSVSDLIKGEEGSIRPSYITKRLRKALDKANNDNQYVPDESIQEPVGKLLAAIEDANSMRDVQNDMYTNERRQRFAKAENINAGGREGFFNRLGQMKGSYEKVGMEEPLKLDESEVNTLFDHIDKSELMTGEKLNASIGLNKLIGGQGYERSIPTPYESHQLEKVFGSGFNKQIQLLHGGLSLPGGNLSLLKETGNLAKSLRASIDLSAPLRQGAPLAATKEYWKSAYKMTKNLGSQKYYDNVIGKIKSKESFQPVIIEKAGKAPELGPSLAERAGIKLTGMHDYGQMEEQYMSKIAEKVPGVTHSERAYVGFLNELRADTFDRLITDAKRSGLDIEKNPVVLRKIGNYVNVATGRGDLGAFEKVAPELNNFFFSPRLLASRIQMLDPRKYITEDPFIRKQYWRSAAGLAGIGLTSLGLMKLMGADVSTNTTNADFGKAKIGNTRLDPWAGFQQYFVLLSRLVNGEYTSSTTGKTIDLGAHYGSPTKMSLLGNFAANKLSPIARFAYDWLNATKAQPFDSSSELANLFVPMVMQDMYDIAKDDPKLLPLIIPSAFGMGVQTYQNRFNKPNQ